MSTLYSYKGAYPQQLPKDLSGYSMDDFIVVPDKPILTPGEVLEWSGSGWTIRPSNHAESAIRWQAVRNQRNTLLDESDVLVIRYTENSQTVPQEVKDYRQSLRDVTQQSNPFDIVWPVRPVVQ